jgi:hypothetical protein
MPINPDWLPDEAQVRSLCRRMVRDARIKRQV